MTGGAYTIPLIGGGYVPAPAPDAMVAQRASESLRRWRSEAAHVEAALSELDSALELLEGREGARVDAARGWLTAEIDRLRKPLDAWRRWAETSAQLVAEISSAREAQAAVEIQHANAEPKDAAKLRDRLEAAQATLRAAHRHMSEACEAINPPAKTELEKLKQAKHETVNLAAVSKPARQIHMALDQGLALARARKGELVARLWVCWEIDPELTDVYALRHQRYIEA